MQVKALSTRVLILLFAFGWLAYSRLYCSPMAVPFAGAILLTLAVLDVRTILAVRKSQKLEQQRVAEKIRMS